MSTTTDKNLEQEYRDLSHLLSELIKALPLHLFIKDTGDDFKYIYSSPLMSQVYGRQSEDVIGKTDFEVFSDTAIAQEFRDIDEKIVKTGKAYKYIDPVVDPNGLLRIMDTSKLLIERENKPPYLLGMACEVTKLKQTEEQLQGFHRHLALACQAGHIYPWEWDFVRDTAELSIPKNGQIQPVHIVHKSFADFVHPDDRALYDKATKKFSAGKSDSLKVAFRSNYFTTDYIWYEKLGEIYERSEDGKAIKAMGIMRDITTDKQHEADIHAKKIAEESDRMKSAFIANMSHEIRTPLNAIVGFSSLIAEAETEEEKKSFLRIIESSNEYLLQLINDILDISKIESGKMEFIYTSFHINEMFAPQERTFSLRAESGVDVIFENKGEDYTIVSEKTRLTQVLTNFLSNAVKFTSEGSIRFGYKVADASLYVYVTDTGTGINQERANTVFERFVKLDSFKQGTGLGLSISKTIINMLNGEIGVNTEEGKGSTFWFQIPCVPIKVK